jgi:hypothetical protein
VDPVPHQSTFQPFFESMLLLSDRLVGEELPIDSVLREILNDDDVKARVMMFLSRKQPLSSATGVVVMQGEQAMVYKGDMAFIGSTDATTCLIVSLVSTDNKAWVAHYDEGTSVEDLESIDRAIEEMSHAEGFLSDMLSEGAAPLSLFLVGGFLDKRGISKATVRRVLRHLRDHRSRLSLELACILELNTTTINETTPAPIAQSLVVDLQTCTPLATDLSDLRGPEVSRRFAYPHCTLPSIHRLVSIFDPERRLLVLPEVTVNLSPSHLQYLIRILAIEDDEKLLEVTSTSPKVEGKGFVADVRAAYAFLVANQGRALPSRCYELGHDRGWIEQLT